MKIERMIINNSLRLVNIIISKRVSRQNNIDITRLRLRLTDEGSVVRVLDTRYRRYLLRYATWK